MLIVTQEQDNMSCIARKHDFCLCENKGADLRYTDSTIPLLLKSKISSLLLSSVTGRFVSDLVGNPEDRFSHIPAHMSS